MIFIIIAICFYVMLFLVIVFKTFCIELVSSKGEVEGIEYTNDKFLKKYVHSNDNMIVSSRKPCYRVRVKTNCCTLYYHSFKKPSFCIQDKIGIYKVYKRGKLQKECVLRCY